MRSHNGSGRRNRAIYQVTDGLYEVKKGMEFEYLAIVKTRRYSLSKANFETALEKCQRGGFDIAEVFDAWAKTSQRSADSFVETAIEMYRSVERERRRDRAAMKLEYDATMSAWTAREIYFGSDASATKRFLKRLEEAGDLGWIAAQLFRAQKSSSRAKQYRGASVGRAYDRKAESMADVCAALAECKVFQWGWKEDPMQTFAPWVLYVDLPTGQVSFHSCERDLGPDYPGQWDRTHESEERIIRYCDQVAHG